jgi:hypothetical protein
VRRRAPGSLPFSRGELAGADGPEAGDDHEVIRVVVQAEEAEIGQGAEAGGA